jgi:hypothetical protein
MFGFGKSAHHKAVINLFALQFEALGLPEATAIAQGTALVDEVLSEIHANGIDPFKTTQGDEYAGREQFTLPRLNEGLTVNDIRAHWNRPLLVVLTEAKMREKLAAFALYIAEQQGQALEDAGRRYAKVTPQYGNPKAWDPLDPANAGLRQVDAAICPEFAGRIEAWRAKTPEKEIGSLVELHGSFNALVRHLVSTKSI